MNNMFMVIGRIKNIDNENNIISLLIENKDLIEVTMGDFQKDKIGQYLIVGDLCAIKGEIKSGNKLVATKITFLSTKAKEEGK